MKRFLSLALVVATLAASVSAQFLVSQYTFLQYPTTYVPLVGATSVTPSSWDDGSATVAIGFPFTYNGTAYTQVRFAANGWIQFGTAGTSNTNYTPISNATSTAATANHFGAFARDLMGQTGVSTMSTFLQGPPGGQVFTLEWSAFRRFSATTYATDNLNFQINLFEATSEIEVVYGTMASGSVTNTTAQVGMRGATNTDYNNRSITVNDTWATSTQGVTNAATAIANFGNNGGVPPALLPVSGQAYRWTPPASIFLTLSAGTTLPVPNNGAAVFTATVGIYPIGTPFSGTAVTANLTNVGGAASQPMLDDGVAPDALANDNIFTLGTNVTVAQGGTFSVPFSATAAGGLFANASTSIDIYTLANDFPAGALSVGLGVNAGLSNTGSLVLNDPALTATCVGSSHDVFYVWTAPCTGTASFTTCQGFATTSSGYLNDTVLAVRSLAGAILACDDDGTATSGPGGSNICGTNGFQSMIGGGGTNAIAVTAGTTYLIQVATYGTGSANMGMFDLTISMTSAQATSSGAGCSAGGPIMALTSGLPILGSMFTIDASGANPFDPGIVAYDVAGNVVINFGCDLYLDPNTAQLVILNYDALGAISIPVTLPYIPALCGASFDLQAFSLPIAGGFGTSNKRTIVFGL